MVNTLGILSASSPQGAIQTGAGARRLPVTTAAPFDFTAAIVDLRTVNAAPFSQAWTSSADGSLLPLVGFGPRAFIVDQISAGDTLVVELIDGTTCALLVTNLIGVEIRLAIKRILAAAAGTTLQGGITFLW